VPADDRRPVEVPFRSDLGGHLGFLLRLAHVDAFTRFHAAAGLSGAQVTEATLLHLVALNPGIRQGVLARHLRLKRAHMTKIVQGLEARGCLALDVPPEDRRSVTLRLTEGGQAALAGMWPAVERGEAAVQAALAPADRAAALALLSRMLADPGTAEAAEGDADEP
jgi:DNA-binding MarR family transcriptional regulator